MLSLLSELRRVSLKHGIAVLVLCLLSSKAGSEELKSSATFEQTANWLAAKVGDFASPLYEHFSFKMEGGKIVLTSTNDDDGCWSSVTRFKLSALDPLTVNIQKEHPYEGQPDQYCLVVECNSTGKGEWTHAVWKSNGGSPTKWKLLSATTEPTSALVIKFLKQADAERVARALKHLIVIGGGKVDPF